MDYTSGFDYGTYDTYGSSYGSSSDNIGAAAAGLVAGLGALGIGAIILISLLSLAVLGVCLWIHSLYFKKMGYSPWLALLKLIPLADFIMFLYFAFSQWPVEKQAKELLAANNKPEVKA